MAKRVWRRIGAPADDDGTQASGSLTLSAKRRQRRDREATFLDQLMAKIEAIQERLETIQSVRPIGDHCMDNSVRKNEPGTTVVPYWGDTEYYVEIPRCEFVEKIIEIPKFTVLEVDGQSTASNHCALEARAAEINKVMDAGVAEPCGYFSEKLDGKGLESNDRATDGEKDHRGPCVGDSAKSTRRQSLYMDAGGIREQRKRGKAVTKQQQQGDGLKAAETVWPRPGEYWQFNGQAEFIQTYSDSKGEKANRNNHMSCRGGNENYLRDVKILDITEPGGMVKIKGTRNLDWVEGWIDAVDAEGVLIFDYSTLNETLTVS